MLFVQRVDCSCPPGPQSNALNMTTPTSSCCLFSGLFSAHTGCLLLWTLHPTEVSSFIKSRWRQPEGSGRQAAAGRRSLQTSR